jgi:hypothetical protein
MDQKSFPPKATKNPIRRAILIYGSTVVVTAVFCATLIRVVEAKRLSDIKSVPGDDQSIFSYLDNRPIGEFADFPLRGVQGRTHLPLNVARCVALAPRSISIGLRRFKDLKEDSKPRFGQALCAGGDPEQVDDFCRRIGTNDVDAASAVAFAGWLPYLTARRIVLQREWFDALMSREWSQDQLDELQWPMRKLVAYPGWYSLDESPRRGPEQWQKFKEWWTSHRASIKADAGGPLRVAP